MRNIWNWIADNAAPITVAIALLGGFAAVLQFSVVRPMQQGFDAVNQRIDDQITYIDQRFDDQDRSINQRFDDQERSINQRFDAQDRRIEDLIKDVAELRGLSDRVTRNETRIDTLSEQVQAGDAPSP